MFRAVALGLSLAVTAAAPAVAEALRVDMAYLRLDVPPPPTLSNLDPIPDDLGQAGAELALADNRTTAKFLGHDYAMTVTRVPEGGDITTAAQDVLATARFVVLDMPDAALLAVADLPEATGAILFNAASRSDALRDDACRANLFHTIPSQAMRADALTQFLIARKWTDVALIEGPREGDRAFGDAMRRSIKKFGLRLRGEKAWTFDADMRRNAAQEVPLFTQDFKSHDVVLVADEADDFARYIPYNTWDARPVAGSAGLVPLAWSRVVEQWGAAQLQSRFEELTGRDMRAQDYAAWAAIRTLGEAVTRTGSNDPDTLRAYILSDAFELGGFKGRPLSFRHWNGQMRQPVALVQPTALVASAPLEGFLHQRNELDTLGLDAPESKCTAFEE